MFQQIYQLKYADECFVLTTSYTQTDINNLQRDIRPDRTIMFRFELKYLGEYRYRVNPDTLLFGYLHPSNAAPKGLNSSKYDNPAVTALLEQGRAARSLEEQQQRYGEAQKIVADRLSDDGAVRTISARPLQIVAR